MHREKKHKEETEHKSDINIGNKKKRRSMRAMGKRACGGRNEKEETKR